jgi:hypothetical protein
MWLPENPMPTGDLERTVERLGMVLIEEIGLLLVQMREMGLADKPG